MECIRQTNDIKIEAGDVKISKFQERIYGLEGILALKNFKRNKGRYRSIILSLTLSVVLFVAAGAFVTDLKKASKQAEEVTNYDIGFSAHDMNDSKMLELYSKLKTAEGVGESSYQAVMEFLCTVQSGELSGDYRETAGEILPNETVNLPVVVQFLDDTTYLQIINHLGLPVQEYRGENAKLIAVAKMEDNGGQAETVNQLRNLFSDSSVNAAVIPKGNGEPDMRIGQNVSITCVDLVPPDIPPYTGRLQQRQYFFQIMAPWSLKDKFVSANASADLIVKGFTFRSENPLQSTAQMRTMLDCAGVSADYTLYNVYALLEQNRSIIFIVNLFAVVFIFVISLIAVANVFNTISTNIKLRRRELAMLCSIGMSDCDFNKMISFECVLYGEWTLLIGLPVSGILSWLIYMGMVAGGAVVDFAFPWNSIIITILCVCFVIFITMMYAAGKIRKENIIDALRDDMD